MSATDKAVYTATEVAYGWGRGSDEKANTSYWAGVVMQKPLLNTEKAEGDGRKDGQMDGQTNGKMDGWLASRPAEQMDGWRDITSRWIN